MTFYYDLDQDVENWKKPYLVPGNSKVVKFFRMNKGNYYLKALLNHQLQLYGGEYGDLICEINSQHYDDISGIIKIRNRIFTCSLDGRISLFDLILEDTVDEFENRPE